jgi:hypothetical protein
LMSTNVLKPVPPESFMICSTGNASKSVQIIYGLKI